MPERNEEREAKETRRERMELELTLLFHSPLLASHASRP
jgi:hypothetical protein